MLISCWKTPQNAGNSLSELQKIQNFLGGGACPQTPPEARTFGDQSTQLSQSPSLKAWPELLPYDVYLLVKPCIYML